MSAQPTTQSCAARYLDVVEQFAKTAFRHGRDHYGPFATPLFADGIDIDTQAPVEWVVGNEHWILSNLGSQQNFFRTLQGLSALRDDVQYVNAAKAAVAYAFDQVRYGDLLGLGGHMAYDLRTKRVVCAPDKGCVHELKCHYPHYDLLWNVDQQSTHDYISAMWHAHIIDWTTLEFSRHGRSKPDAEFTRDFWHRPYQKKPVFFVGQGLTFANAGSDLVFAAGMLASRSGDLEPLQWAKRLIERYVDTRHPNTGLGGYQFSLSVLPGPKGRGDRAQAQFGEQLQHHAPTEANFCVGRQIHTIVGETALNKLLLAERLGHLGDDIRTWAVEDLLAYAAHSFDPSDGTFHPVLTSGRRLTGLVIEKDGYYGKSGQTLEALRPDYLILWSYTLAYRLTRSSRLWRVSRVIARALQLGDIGASGATPDRDLARHPSVDDPIAVFALLEMFKSTKDSSFVTVARHIADRLIAQRFHKGVFVRSERHRFAKFDSLEPLALLALVGALQNTTAVVPSYWGAKPFFGSTYAHLGHQIDNHLIYGQVREELV